MVRVICCGFLTVIRKCDRVPCCLVCSSVKCCVGEGVMAGLFMLKLLATIFGVLKGHCGYLVTRNDLHT